MSEHVSILVVDDDLLDRAAVRRALKSSGLVADVVEAEDDAAALTALATCSFDVLLLDYQLPGTDGLALLRSVRAAGITTPVIVMTGQGDEQLAVEIMKAGATDYLAKGRMSSEVLASSVRHALRVHQAEMHAAEATAQRQQAEVALRQNERLLAITLKSIGDAVIATDAQGCITFMNTMAESLTGWSADEAINRPFEEVLPLLDAATRAPCQHLVGAVLQSGAHVDHSAELLAQTRTGQQFPVVSSSAPIRGEDDTPVGVVVVFRDMTERVRMEERLRFLVEMSQVLGSSLDYQAHLSSLTQLAVPRFADLCAIDVVKPDGIQRLAFAAIEPIAAAKRYQTEHGINLSDPYGPARVIQTGQTEYYREVSPTLLDQATPEHRTIIATTSLVSWISVPLSVRGATVGAITFGRTAGRPRYTPDDVSFAEEVAHRTTLAVDNAVLYREAQDAVHARDAFLSIASHELKTPLTSLLGYAELLQRRARRGNVSEERTERVMQVMVDQALRLNKMVLTLFDLSRLQTGQLSIEHAPVDVAALAARIVDEVEPTIERHTLHLQCVGEPLVISGDELRLEQVIQNLIQNAIKYSPDGGPISVRVAPEGGGVQISVQDRGLGIPQESLPRIFRRFYRAENAEPYQISGMGVGLYVAKQIVDLHGGRVDVESAEGSGSTFIVWLPVAPPEER